MLPIHFGARDKQLFGLYEEGHAPRRRMAVVILSPIGWEHLRAHRTLLHFGLVSEFANPQGFPSVKYYRLSERGRDFADRACDSWRRRPLLERLAVRLTG